MKAPDSGQLGLLEYGYSLQICTHISVKWLTLRVDASAETLCFHTIQEVSETYTLLNRAFLIRRSVVRIHPGALDSLVQGTKLCAVKCRKFDFTTGWKPVVFGSRTLKRRSTSLNMGGVSMSSELRKFETAQAHAHFSGSCFNRAWDLVDNSQWPPNEEEQMLLLAIMNYSFFSSSRIDCSLARISARN